MTVETLQSLAVSARALAPNAQIHCSRNTLNVELKNVGIVYLAERWGGEWSVQVGTIGTNLTAAELNLMVVGLQQLHAVAALCEAMCVITNDKVKAKAAADYSTK